MKLETIKKIAKETGVDFYMYERPQMKFDGKTVRYVSTGKLTPFGNNIVKFANAVEGHKEG